MKTALVCGAGGFIGHHLVKFLKAEGYWVRGVDVKFPEYEDSAADEFYQLDLRDRGNCLTAVRLDRYGNEGVDEVYQLAADMGGIGYISGHRSKIATENVLINTHMLMASEAFGVKRHFYSSSACVYPAYRQNDPDVTPLCEEDAAPAEPEEGYGWEKLYSEKLCEYYNDDGKVPTRVARFHNVFGPLGTYDGGREKAPAALCRKVALAEDGGEIEVWGDGAQTRSFMYVDDCVEGIYRITQSDYDRPLNLGTDYLVTIDELAAAVADVAGKTITVKHVDGPQGVRGRNSDNSLLYDTLGWEPRFSLREGLAATYPWIAAQVARNGSVVAPETVAS